MARVSGLAERAITCEIVVTSNQKKSVRDLVDTCKHHGGANVESKVGDAVY